MRFDRLSRVGGISDNLAGGNPTGPADGMGVVTAATTV